MTIDKTRMIGLGLGLGLLVSLAACGDDSGSGNDSDPVASTGDATTDDTASTTETPVTTTEGTTTEGTTTEDTTTEDTTTEDTTTEGTVDSSGSGDPPGDCMGAGEGAGAEGDACTANGDCASGVCTIFTDLPLNDDAVCAPTPDACGTRVTGTVFDFATGEPVAGATLVVASGLQALTNPTGAMALVEATSGDDGRVDSTSAAAISAPLGIVGLASAAGYDLTGTGLAAPGPDRESYDVGTSTHDIWMVPEAALSDWSDALSGDPDVLAGDLPLGDAGGIVGFVRGADGVGIADVVVASTSDSTESVVRYLNDDGTFGDIATSALGIFVILRPGFPEDFEATLDGSALGGGTVASANGVVFALIINAG